MNSGFIKRFAAWIVQIGAKDTDSDETKIQKSLLVVCSIPFMIAGTLWGLMYLYFGEKYAAVIPLSYSVFSLLSLIHFGFTQQFGVFRFSQLLLILLLPFALMITLGGFVNGSAIIAWGIFSPLGSLLFYKRSAAPYWLLAFVILIVISYLLEPNERLANHLSVRQINFFFLINSVAVSSLIFLMVYYFVGRKSFYEEQSEQLLLNILPKETAAELKSRGIAEPKKFEQVTVMFTDFKDFTRLSEMLSADELVKEIHFCYSEFDKIISKHNIEKIKTIGDSYMCAGGLPVPNKTNAIDVVNGALEIQKFMRRLKADREKENKQAFDIRIGIHSGPVVAGIVGIKKFAYDIWGDTVNIASRMESSGEVGKVNISGATYELVKEKFHCVFRGKIPAKNKGEVAMYFVEEE